MIDREELNQWEKFKGFKLAFETYKHHLENQNFIASYVIAFSVLEDRINAIYYTRELIDNRKKPSGYIPISAKIRHIYERGDISENVRDKWLEEAKNRNHKIHQAMWNIEAFKSKDCDRVIGYAREADKLRSKQKRAYRT